MAMIAALAEAAVQRDGFLLRGLVQDFLRAYPDLVATARAERALRPDWSDEVVERLAARLACTVADEQPFRLKTDRERHLPVLRRAIVGGLR